MATSTLLHIAVQLASQSRFQVIERLDGVNVGLTFYTVVRAPGYADNPTTRTGSWFLDVLDVLGQPIARGLRVGAGVDLLFPFRAYSSTPPGKLFALTTDGADPDLLAFAEKRARMVYQSAAEVVASGGST